MRIRSFYFYAMIILFSQTVYAQDMGQYGTTFRIAEMDMRVYIQKRLQALQISGQLALYQNQLTKRAKAHVLRPDPVVGIVHTIHERIFYYDPTFELHHAIRDALGQILVPAGKKVNPLKIISFHRILLFFDGDDKRQIQWVKQQFIQYQNSTDIKPIAISGNIKKMSHLLSTHVYFDQNGFLVRKLGILHVPCRVTPDHLRLKLHEILLSQDEEGMHV